MKAGILLSQGDPRTAAELAAAAEDAGWDGVFTWDGVAVGTMDTYDPWVLMAAMAMTTERVRLGAIVTPPARRRPWKLARETMTLDRLSNGRLVLPVGLGTLDDAAFGNVGEPTEARIRAERLDESLSILEGLWSGRPFAFEGRHYRFDEMTFLPTPVQQPRIPIWVIGVWPHERSVRRALRFDGIYPQTSDPAVIREVGAFIDAERPGGRTDFEIVVEGSTRDADDVAGPHAAAAAGATWWIESDWESATLESLRARVAAGPPRAGI